MIERDKTRLYRRRLDELETDVGEPVIPGEVGEWCESVGKSLSDVRNAWAPVLGVHEVAYHGILDINVEMGGRVERLRADDTRASNRLAVLTRHLTHAKRICDPDHTSEEPVDDIEVLRTDLLTWVAVARGHEKEVDRWMVEASLRDSGFSD